MANDRKRARLVTMAVASFAILGVGVAVGLWLMRSDKSMTSAEAMRERGWALYTTHCMSCHGNKQAQFVLGQPPPHNAQGHTWHHADAELQNWILGGKPYGMPAFQGKLTEEDVTAILALIKSWWTEEQRKTQAEISRQYEEALKKYQR